MSKSKSEVDKLRPCPFCGSDMSSFAGMTEDAFCKTENPKTFAVACDCNATGSFAWTMEEAVKAWNGRAL